MPNPNLEDLKAYLTNIRKELNILSPLYTFKNEVEENIKKLENQLGYSDVIQMYTKSLEVLFQTEERYINVFQQLFKEKFFPWNNRDTSNDLQNDIERYITLIGYCFQLKDTRMLDELGIYPLCQNDFLAQPGDQYIEIFNYLKENKSNSDKRLYYEYLIRAFEYLFPKN